MAFILCSFSLCCDGFGGLWGPGGIHLVSCCDCFGGFWGALGSPLVPFDHAKTRVSRYSGFGMDFWFHFGTFGVPWATQWHQFSLPGPVRVGLLGSLGGRLAFILQPCGVSKDECQRASGARLLFILWPNETHSRLFHRILKRVKCHN